VEKPFLSISDEGKVNQIEHQEHIGDFFFYYKGIVHQEFILAGQTVKKHDNREVSQYLGASQFFDCIMRNVVQDMKREITWV
jgi:hypothetical protein